MTTTNPPAGQRLRVLWSCHASCINQLFCDANGDLVCPTHDPITLKGNWSDNEACVIIDDDLKDYIVLQALCEKTLGFKIARKQPINPRGGLYIPKAWKKSEGLKVIIITQTYK